MEFKSQICFITGWMWMVNLGICQESSHQPTQCQCLWDSSSGLQGPSSPHPPPQCLCSTTSHDLCFSQILKSLQAISMKYGHFRHFSKTQNSRRRWLSFLTICFSHHEHSCAFICITFISEPPALSTAAHCGSFQTSQRLFITVLAQDCMLYFKDQR